MPRRSTARTAVMVTAVLAATVLAAGCGSQPSTGTVIGKRSEPGHWETKQACARKVDGKCRQWKTTRKWDDTDYELLIRSDGSEDWVEVDVDTYGRVQVGGRRVE